MSFLNKLSKKYVAADSKALEKVCFNANGKLFDALSEFRKEIAPTGIFILDKDQKLDKQIDVVANAFSDLFGVCKKVLASYKQGD